MSGRCRSSPCCCCRCCSAAAACRRACTTRPLPRAAAKWRGVAAGVQGSVAPMSKATLQRTAGAVPAGAVAATASRGREVGGKERREAGRGAEGMLSAANSRPFNCSKQQGGVHPSQHGAAQHTMLQHNTVKHTCEGCAPLEQSLDCSQVPLAGRQVQRGQAKEGTPVNVPAGRKAGGRAGRKWQQMA